MITVDPALRKLDNVSAGHYRSELSFFLCSFKRSRRQNHRSIFTVFINAAITGHGMAGSFALNDVKNRGNLRFEAGCSQASAAG